MRRTIILYLAIFLEFNANAQPAEYKMSRKEYIDKYKDDAIKEMLMYHVPASIILAQGMLESGNGNSALAVYANNHFGIKCHKNWDGPSYVMDDDEKNECFRKYSSVLESYSDHSQFLKDRPRYAFLFDLKITDYKAWAKGLKEAGYATDPKYSDRLIEIIQQNNLNQYDDIQELENISPKVEKTKTVIAKNTRKIEEFNRIKYIIIKEGDTFYKIANDCNLDLWQIYRYNDLNKDDKLIAGQKLYLYPKKRKAKEEFHIVMKGENMRSISQLHGIKLKILYKKNLMKKVEEPKVGDKLYLRKKKKT